MAKTYVLADVFVKTAYFSLSLAVFLFIAMISFSNLHP
jgi:hypothetical protein